MSGQHRHRLKDQFGFVRVVVDDNFFAVVHLAADNQPAESCFHLLLDRSFERPRAIDRIVASLHQMRPRLIRQRELNVAIRQTLAQARELDFHDLLQVLLIEGMEDNDLVDAVEKLRPETAAELVHHRILHVFVAASGKTLLCIRGCGGCRRLTS